MEICSKHVQLLFLNLFCGQCKVMLANEKKREVFKLITEYYLRFKVNEERNIKRTQKICVYVHV